MQYQLLIQDLQRRGITAREREPLSRHTTFKIGGPAAVFCEPETGEQLSAALRLCKEAGVRRYLLGKGSNVLFADEGFDGVVVCLNRLACRARREGNTLWAGAGDSLARVCTAAAKAGLGGLEFAYGIPGSVGGAVYMNAGAYGGEIKDVLQAVTFLDETGGEHTLPASQLQLGYRTSIFEQRPWCVLQAQFCLTPADPAEIGARMRDYADRRAEKQPLDLPSAGSTFKRPAGAFAGALIQQCGLRGFSVGGAAISEKHCGFVVNQGGATCADVLALTEEVCRIVREKTGYVLEKEVRVVR